MFRALVQPFCERAECQRGILEGSILAFESRDLGLELSENPLGHNGILSAAANARNRPPRLDCSPPLVWYGALRLTSVHTGS